MQRSPSVTVIVLACSVLVATGLTAEEQPQAAWLITPEEAALAEALPSTPATVAMRGKVAGGTGPTLELVTPEEGTPAHAPVTIFIKFTENRAPIDLDSLKVTLVKIVKIDITERLRPYVSAEGIRIDDGRIPSGKFRLRLQLADVDGNLTVGEGVLNII